MGRYAYSQPELIASDVDPASIEQDPLDQFFVPAVFLRSIGVAVVDADVAAYSWFLLALRRPLGQLRHRRRPASVTPNGR